MSALRRKTKAGIGKAEEEATERVKFASRCEINERINHIDIWKSRILYRWNS